MNRKYTILLIFLLSVAVVYLVQGYSEFNIANFAASFAANLLAFFVVLYFWDKRRR